MNMRSAIGILWAGCAAFLQAGEPSEPASTPAPAKGAKGASAAIVVDYGPARTSRSRGVRSRSGGWWTRMQWVTRARPKTDRIACPWLIRKFIDPQAEIVYVPPDEVLTYAEEHGARGQ